MAIIRGICDRYSRDVTQRVVVQAALGLLNDLSPEEQEAAIVKQLLGQARKG